MLRLALLVLIALTLALVPAGCGSSTSGDTEGTAPADTGPAETQPGDGDTTSTRAIQYPTGEEDLVLRVEEGGGFVPVEFSLTNLPSFSLYGQGLVLTPAPMIEIFPQPAVAELQQTTIPPDGIQAILARAADVGLLEPGDDLGSPPIADAPTTAFTVHAEGRTVETSVYALGYETPMDGGGSSGITQDQLTARHELDAFRSELSDLDSFIEAEQVEWDTYEPQAMAVFFRPAEESSGGGTGGADEIRPNTLEWPLGDLASLGEETTAGYRRAVVGGEDLKRLKPLLAEATTITLWQSDGISYNLAFRPLLPDEE